MKKAIILIILTSLTCFAQFKGDENKPIDLHQGILSDNPVGSLFSFIDPSKFSMGHSFEMSYSAMGRDGLALGVYTNHLSYEFSEVLNVQIDASIVNSPYNSFGDKFTNSLNGVYLDRARINYNPSENFQMSIQFSNSPFGYYNRSYRRGFSPYSSLWRGW